MWGVSTKWDGIKLKLQGWGFALKECRSQDVQNALRALAQSQPDHLPSALQILAEIKRQRLTLARQKRDSAAVTQRREWARQLPAPSTAAADMNDAAEKVKSLPELAAVIRRIAAKMAAANG